MKYRVDNMNIRLSNGVLMPMIGIGLPLIMRGANRTFDEVMNSVSCAFENGCRALDTSHDYGRSEEYIGRILRNFKDENRYNREDVFITTKIGNGQQQNSDIEECVNEALRVMQIDYIDCMLLHWPVPNVWIENWHKLEMVYQSGKLRTIGIANIQERHLKQLLESGVSILPHVTQIELHPFRTVPSLMAQLREHNIAVQAYTSLCQMIPLVTENELLRNLSKKYNKSIAAIILRWHIQQGVMPLFRSFTRKHIVDSMQALCFELSKEDQDLISALDIDFKYHPESMSCVGF